MICVYTCTVQCKSYEQRWYPFDSSQTGKICKVARITQLAYILGEPKIRRWKVYLLLEYNAHMYPTAELKKHFVEYLDLDLNAGNSETLVL